MLKYACYEILCPFRISSLLIPLVNLTDLYKKFGTHWHTCAITCAKSTIFQICLYETKLNGNNLNYIYNFRKFKLFPFVSVSLSSICVCCSYFPMQKFLNTLISTSSLDTDPTISARWRMQARRSRLTRSAGMPSFRPRRTSCIFVKAFLNAS